MYLRKEDGDKLLTELHTTIGDAVFDQFESLLSLVKKDQWTFIVKSHAIIEATIGDLVIALLGNQPLEQFVRKLPLHGEQGSKLALIRNYDCLEKEHITFLKEISELRNKLVHNTSNFDFDFNRYIADFDKNQRRSWRSKVLWFARTDETTLQNWQKILEVHPALTICIGIGMVLALVTTETKRLEGVEKILRLSEKTMSELFSNEYLEKGPNLG